jgi:tetratricopeptide (TPR) repeat protein
MATQFSSNVVVLPQPTPTTADRNRAAEAFARSLECAAAGDIAPEEAALRMALDAVPDDPAANINYGNRMYDSGRFHEALACYNLAVGTPTANVLALFNRGDVLEELGFFAEAIADWTAAVTLAPDFGDAHYNLARALSRDGRLREALRHWTKYLALDRVSTWASRARQERKRLLKLEPLQIVSRKIARAARRTSSAWPSASAARLRSFGEPQRIEFVSSCWSCPVRRMPKAGLSALRRISQLRHSGLAEDGRSRHQGRQGFRLFSPRHYNKRSRLQISTHAWSRS